MPHLQKKFLFQEQYKIDHPYASKYPIIMDAELMINHIKKVDKNSLLILETKDSKKILAYKYEKSGSTSIIPIPDFSIVNFDIALQLHERVLSSKKRIN